MDASYQPSYEVVLEPGNLVFTMLGCGVHGDREAYLANQNAS